MNTAKITEHNAEPYFDLEAFMEMSHETRLGGAVLERLSVLWEDWLKELQVREINTGKINYLAVWLSKNVEDKVDQIWQNSPSEGFLADTLASFMCMSTLQELIPEIELSACAPSPRPTETLRKLLEELGLPYKNANSDLLALRYAVLTHYPFRGGCEICHLQPRCPKGQGEGANANILLPGYERTDTNPLV